MKAAEAMQASDTALDLLEGRLKIDKYDLDNEMIDHPSYLAEIGRRHADAVSYRDEAKNDLDGRRAYLDGELRQAHIEAQEKFTEGSLGNEIIGHPDFQRAQKLLGAWNDRVNQWRVLWEAAGARTDMLKSLSHLYTSNYWADRASSTVTREVRTDRADSARQRVADMATQRAEKAAVERKVLPE